MQNGMLKTNGSQEWQKQVVLPSKPEPLSQLISAAGLLLVIMGGRISEVAVEKSNLSSW